MPEMKDSGIEWIGEIPKDWTVIRLKYICDFKTGGTPNSKIGIDIDGDYKWITASDFNPSYIIRASKQYITRSAIKNNGYKLFPPNSILLVCIASVGKVGIIDTPSYSNQQITALIPNEYIFPHYLMYAAVAGSQQIQFDASSNVVPIVNTGYLQNFTIPYSSYVEQSRIADFLDSKCSEIDALTVDIQKEIEVLEEYKKSVITEAVTKGLDPNVEMIESPIYYMSPYNSKWRLSKIGYECNKLSRVFAEEDIPLICSNKGKVLQRPTEMSGKMVSEDNAMQGIHKGDIAIHGMDTWHGAIAVSDYSGKITRVVHVCDSVNDKRFIVYYLQQLAFNGVYKLISNGVRGNTSDFRSWDKVKSIGIALPDIEEQSRIADYLDDTCEYVENIVTEKNEQLSTLEEYKKSVIYEYVTGKKEVTAQ